MNKGVALYLAVVVMALLLVIVLGLTAVARNQIIMVRDSEESVLALYAADAGVEEFLTVAVRANIAPNALYGPITLNNGASYRVDVKCCRYSAPSAPGCIASAVTCGSLPQDASCEAKFFCAKSVGSYRGTTRGVSVDI